MVVALLLAVLVTAQPTTAKGALEAGDFELALDLVTRTLAKEAVPLERARLKLIRAQCLAAMRRTNEVDEAIEAALNDAPALELDTEATAPSFQATFQRLKTQLAGRVQITTSPSGLAVKLNGAVIGTSPLTQLLPVGRYALSAVSPTGVETAPRELVVPPRQKLSLELEAPPRISVAGPVDAGLPEVTTVIPRQSGTGWVVVPMASARLVVDPLAPGVGVEGGLGAVANYWLAELDFVGGRRAGLGVRAGVRLPLAGELLSLQLTVDGVVFFGPGAGPGLGGTFAVGLRPLRFLEVLAEAGGRWVSTVDFRTGYLLAGLSVRVRWPWAS